MNAAEKELMNYMSDLSERAYCAGWMSGLEYELWEAVVKGTKEYGRLRITGNHIRKLKELSDACGGWIIFIDGNGETFVSMEEWLCLYKTREIRKTSDQQVKA